MTSTHLGLFEGAMCIDVQVFIRCHQCCWKVLLQRSPWAHHQTEFLARSRTSKTRKTICINIQCHLFYIYVQKFVLWIPPHSSTAYLIRETVGIFIQKCHQMPSNDYLHTISALCMLMIIHSLADVFLHFIWDYHIETLTISLNWQLTLFSYKQSTQFPFA